MQVSETKPCVLRILNGPLSGAEFTLTRPVTLVVVGPPAQYCDGQSPSTVPVEALYVPLEQASSNFEILLGENSLNGCQVRWLETAQSREETVPFQTPHQVGSLLFALKPSDEPWADRVLSTEGTASATTKGAGRAGWLVGAAAVVLLAAAGGMAYWLQDTSVASVETVLAGAAGPLDVVRGSNGQVYVFAEHEREARWARQVLMRQGVQGTTQVLVRREERDRVQAMLADAFPAVAYHRLDLAHIQLPQLWLSQQRNLLTPGTQKALETALLAAMPYAREVQVRSADDAELVRVAEQGLARLAIPFERHTKADSVTFSLRGNLTDTDIAAVRDYVSQFYQHYGDRYVYFAVELKDDWLKDKSFQYGAGGYVKLSPSSWYFSKPQ
ncbi:MULTISPECIES: PrgH/EprH family type III secretion apparatus protein [Pseudomonas]|uniref:PrgH/EprH family type III secretion apparatus protein n=1 Tax=Pseudomonas quercus TaxID=2722792 RepID=A0ABX0YB96_9PSED|nr:MULTISPECIES: PrgH/EprH family type III secretion apparatus protein [Pseudomonas]MBF7141022.1 PrgH/EprH family type III secretion apparatus protein [Pseudomonas sp. LY10J]NJO99556.1 PrgH/EprH family type III secretion apparatus protein [Pseudomonas quercus]